MKLKNRYKYLIFLSLIVFPFAVGLISKNTYGSKSPSDNFFGVNQGPIEYSISGSGYLVPTKEKIISVGVDSKIKKINFKPGDRISENDSVMELMSYSLSQDLNAASVSLIDQQLKAHEQEISHNIEKINIEFEIKEYESQEKLLKREGVALSALAEKNVISDIEKHRFDINYATVVEKIQLKKDFLKKISGEYNKFSEQQKNLMDKLKENYQFKKLLLDTLTVRSGMEGVLQEISVSEGQSVTAGSALAKVISNKDMICEAKIQQNKISKININTPAEIDIGNKKYIGSVIRIDPKVNDGMVKVALKFSHETPESFLANQSLLVTLSVSSSLDTLYIESVEGLYEGQKKLVNIDRGNGRIDQVNVEVGVVTDKYAQVIASALKVNDKIQFIKGG